MDKLELTDAKELTNQEKEVYRTLRTNLEFTGVGKPTSDSGD